MNRIRIRARFGLSKGWKLGFCIFVIAILIIGLLVVHVQGILPKPSYAKSLGENLMINNTRFQVDIFFLSQEEMYSLEPIKTQVRVLASGNQEFLSNDIAIRIYCDNAAWGDTEQTAYHIPGFIDIPRYSPSQWNRTLFYNFQSSGQTSIRVSTLLDNTLVLDDMLKNTTFIESWSVKYQNAATKLSLTIEMASVGIAVIAVIIALPSKGPEE